MNAAQLEGMSIMHEAKPETSIEAIAAQYSGPSDCDGLLNDLELADAAMHDYARLHGIEITAETQAVIDLLSDAFEVIIAGR